MISLIVVLGSLLIVSLAINVIMLILYDKQGIFVSLLNNKIKEKDREICELRAKGYGNIRR